MVPVVELHDTVTFAVSPVLMNAAAVKLTVSFSCTVTFLGEMTRSATVAPVELSGRGFSHAKTSAVARRVTGNATLRSFSRANRCASLCLNVMGSAPSPGFALRCEEFAHVRSGRRLVRETREPQNLGGQPQRARMLVQRRRLVAPFGFRAHHHPHDPPAAVGVVAAGLVEQNDQQAVLLERRAADERVDVRLEP